MNFGAGSQVGLVRGCTWETGELFTPLVEAFRWVWYVGVGGRLVRYLPLWLRLPGGVWYVGVGGRQVKYLPLWLRLPSGSSTWETGEVFTPFGSGSQVGVYVGVIGRLVKYYLRCSLNPLKTGGGDPEGQPWTYCSA